MAKLFTREQARTWLRENGLKTGDQVQGAFIAEIKGILQEVLEEEMNNHLGYTKYDWKNKATDNSRNGHTKKTIKGEKFGEITLDMPRDTDMEFEPVIVKKHEKTITRSFEDMITTMFAHGTSNRDIEDQMRKLYGLEVSPEMVTRITDKILPIAREWQNRLLEEIYPILYLDGIVFKVNQDGHIVKKTVYIVFGRNIDGMKEILGMWIGEAESSKFWMSVVTDLKNRGVQDILIACVDGLNGFEEAITSVFPNTEIQQCIVHQIRTSTKFVVWKDRKQFCADMREIYTAPNEEAGLAALDRLDEKWGSKYSYAIKSWRTKWAVLSTFFRYPPEIRRMIYTTNQVEGFNRRIRKITKTKGSFPTDDSLFKLLYLIVMDASEKWTSPAHNWGTVVGQLRVYFGDRIDQHL